ncbi:unnamed protein product [Arabidopsis halleri]
MQREKTTIQKERGRPTPERPAPAGNNGRSEKLWLERRFGGIAFDIARNQHDWMRDRAIAYSEELRKVNVNAPVLEYKDAVHEFATVDMFLRAPQAQAWAEDIAIWAKKYISLRGHEFSY